jgi:hypothetical protein
MNGALRVLIETCSRRETLEDQMTCKVNKTTVYIRDDDDELRQDGKTQGITSVCKRRDQSVNRHRVYS